MAGFCQAVYQFHCAVVLDLQACGKLSDQGPRALRQAFQGQQQLMLLRLQPRAACGLLAEVKEVADLISQFREGPIVRQSELLLHARDGFHSQILYIV